MSKTKKIGVFFATVMTIWSGFSMLLPLSAGALSVADCQKSLFLIFRPWYYGQVEVINETQLDGSVVQRCSVKTPENESEISIFVWSIVLNVLSILFSLIGLLALGFVIFGAYLYVLARGDPGRIAKGKNTVIRALIGLVICILASLIVNTLVTIITGAVGA